MKQAHRTYLVRQVGEAPLDKWLDVLNDLVQDHPDTPVSELLAKKLPEGSVPWVATIVSIKREPKPQAGTPQQYEFMTSFLQAMAMLNDDSLQWLADRLLT